MSVKVTLRWEVVCDYCGRSLAFPEQATADLTPDANIDNASPAVTAVCEAFAHCVGTWLGTRTAFTCGTWVDGAQPCPEELMSAGQR